MRIHAVTPSRMWRSRIVAVATCAAIAGAAPAAHAGGASRWLTVGALSGATRFDPHLADYQWRIDPRAAWGAQAIAGAGRVGAGLRV